MLNMLLKLIALVVAAFKGHAVRIAELEAELLQAKESGIASEAALKEQKARSDAAEAKVTELESAELAEDATEAEAIAQLSALLPDYKSQDEPVA
jgi:cell division protein FtsB